MKDFARTLSEQVTAAPFSCLITNDRELQRLNCTFLGLDYPTDVLSFPSATTAGGIGEIAISLERAQAQAQQFGHSTLDELQILMLHGSLHLSGFDHESDRGEMARLERKWRRSLRLPSSLIARNSARQKAVSA